MRRPLLLVGVVVALAIVGCSDGDSSSTDAATTTIAAATTTAPTTTTTAPPTTTTAPTTTVTVTTSTTTTAPPTTTIPEFPDEVQGVHGGSSWGVYVVTSDDPDYAGSSVVATERLLGLGYEWFAYGVSLGCDPGSSDALGLSDDLIAIAIYFATQDDAEVFAAAYEADFGDAVVGIAEVTNFCLD